MTHQNFGTVWGALENTPAEVTSMTMRSNLLIAIEQQVRAWKLTQTAAAKRLAITRPCLNDILRGKIHKFSLDMLMDLARKAGVKVRLRITTPKAV